MMKLEKQCKTCEFNFSGTCAGHGNTYKYGEEIVDETNSCEDWGADLEYFTLITNNAPRFLREPLNDCRISYDQFLVYLEDYINERSVPINIFDAVKFVYGISMIDIAVLLEVTFGVVYRAKTKGIPPKRISQFADVLCISPGLLMNITTQDFNKLEESKKMFYSQNNIEKRMALIPMWKQNLINDISSTYLKCPINIAAEISRVDKVYWSTQMPMDDFTESEKVLIKFISRNSKKHQSAINLEYSLDLACSPHIRAMYNTGGGIRG